MESSSDGAIHGQGKVGSKLGYGSWKVNSERVKELEREKKDVEEKYQLALRDKEALEEKFMSANLWKYANMPPSAFNLKIKELAELEGLRHKYSVVESERNLLSESLQKIMSSHEGLGKRAWNSVKQEEEEVAKRRRIEKSLEAAVEKYKQDTSKYKDRNSYLKQKLDYKEKRIRNLEKDVNSPRDSVVRDLKARLAKTELRAKAMEEALNDACSEAQKHMDNSVQFEIRFREAIPKKELDKMRGELVTCQLDLLAQQEENKKKDEEIRTHLDTIQENTDLMEAIKKDKDFIEKEKDTLIVSLQNQLKATQEDVKTQTESAAKKRTYDLHQKLETTKGELAKAKAGEALALEKKEYYKAEAHKKHAQLASVTKHSSPRPIPSSPTPPPPPPPSLPSHPHPPSSVSSHPHPRPLPIPRVRPDKEILPLPLPLSHQILNQASSTHHQSSRLDLSRHSSSPQNIPELAILKETVKVREAEITRLNKKVWELEKEKRTQDAKTMFIQNQSRVEQLEREKEDLKKSRAEASARLAHWEKMATGLQKDLDNIKSENKTLLLSNSTLSTNIKTSHSNLNALKREAATQKVQISNQLSRIKTCDTHISKQKSRNETLEKENGQLKSNITVLMRDLRKIQASLPGLKQECSQLRERIVNLTGGEFKPAMEELRERLSAQTVSKVTDLLHAQDQRYAAQTKARFDEMLERAVKETEEKTRREMSAEVTEIAEKQKEKEADILRQYHLRVADNHKLSSQVRDLNNQVRELKKTLSERAKHFVEKHKAFIQKCQENADTTNNPQHMALILELDSLRKENAMHCYMALQMDIVEQQLHDAVRERNQLREKLTLQDINTMNTT